MFEFVDEDAAFWGKLSHRDNLIDATLRHHSQTADLESRDEHAIGLVGCDLGRGKDADFSPCFLDGVVQDEILTCQLTDKANENRELYLIEI